MNVTYNMSSLCGNKSTSSIVNTHVCLPDVEVASTLHDDFGDLYEDEVDASFHPSWS